MDISCLSPKRLKLHSNVEDDPKASAVGELVTRVKDGELDLNYPFWWDRDNEGGSGGGGGGNEPPAVDVEGPIYNASKGLNIRTDKSLKLVNVTGGKGLGVNCQNPLTSDENGIGLAAQMPLKADTNGLTLDLDNSLQISNQKLSVKLATSNPGLTKNDGLQVQAAAPFAVNTSGLSLNLVNNGGLEIVDTGLQAKTLKPLKCFASGINLEYKAPLGLSPAGDPQPERLTLKYDTNVFDVTNGNLTLRRAILSALHQLTATLDEAPKIRREDHHEAESPDHSGGAEQEESAAGVTTEPSLPELQSNEVSDASEPNHIPSVEPDNHLMPHRHPTSPTSQPEPSNNELPTGSESSANPRRRPIRSAVRAVQAVTGLRSRRRKSAGHGP